MAIRATTHFPKVYNTRHVIASYSHFITTSISRFFGDGCFCECGKKSRQKLSCINYNHNSTEPLP